MDIKEFQAQVFRENWTKVSPTPNSQRNRGEAEQWCSGNLAQREWARFGPYWYFKRETDAIMFKLRFV